MPTPDVIRVLDGPELTKLAFQLGLGGATRKYVGKAGTRLAAPAAEDDLLDLWEPHENLAQADAVFRSLRARGWTTSVCWFADDRQAGEVWAGTQGRRAVSVAWTGDDPAAEARALLLCTCLAVASAQEDATHGLD
jgi:hypothetical protein